VTVPPTLPTTTTTVTAVTSRYALFSQIEIVTARVTANGAAVSAGQVTITDGGQTQTVNVSGGTATATFTFNLFQAQPLAHPVTATFGGATGFAGSGTNFTAPSTLFGYLFQLYFDAMMLQAFGL
jgi:hypothetical protein